MAGEEWLAWCEATADQGEPPDLDEEEPDSDGLPGSWEYDLNVIVADCRRITAEEAAACARAARLGLAGGQPVGLARRGPGQPGSARRAPGEYLSRAAGFAAGMLLDTMPGCNALAGFAAEAAGDDDRYGGAGDDEVAGAVAAWDRIEAHAAARKHAAVAELIRRRPEPGGAGEGPAQMPAGWDEFTVTELAALLGESRGTAEGLLDLAHDLEVKLPGTKAAFRDGTLRASKVEIIARAAAVLDPAEARAAEALVLGRAGRLTPGGLRAAIARAVMDVAPEKARKRREQAARDARVQRWAEDSGNAALMGRELPPAEVLAADQRITAWARELKKAGLDGDMDVLRARAYLDLLLDKDSRPGPDTAAGQDAAAGPNSSEPGRPPGSGVVPAGFAGRITLTVPLATLLDLADRPAEIPGIGPIDPWLARDLARAAAGHPKTTWCVTVTDQHGHAIGHGCARPEPTGREKRRKPGPPDGRDPPRGTSGTSGPEFSFTARGQHGPPGGYGTWRLRTEGRTARPASRARPDRHRATATTGMRPRATTPGSSSATCPRSGTPPAPGRSAAGPPLRLTSNTTSHTRPVEEAACAMAVRSVGTTTGSSSTPGGRSISSPTAPSSGPPHPAASTPPNQPGTRSSRLRGMAAGGQPRYASAIRLVGEVPVMAGPGDEMAADTAARGHLRTSHADREPVIGALKTRS